MRSGATWCAEMKMPSAGHIGIQYDSSNIIRHFLVMLVFAGIHVCCATASNRDIPSGGRELLSDDLASMRFGAREEAQATGRIVPVAGQPFKQAWRVQHQQRPQHPWNVTLHADIDVAIQQGDTLLLCLYMRCAWGANIHPRLSHCSVKS